MDIKYVFFYGIYWEIKEILKRKEYGEYSEKFALFLISAMLFMNFSPIIFKLITLNKPNFKLHGKWEAVKFFIPYLLIIYLVLYLIFIYNRNISNYIKKYKCKPVKYRRIVKTAAMLYIVFSVIFYYVSIVF